jgi:hypothetical protein
MGTNPTVAVDNVGIGNAYVAWENDGRIMFQKVPSSFAPVNGTVTASRIKTQIITGEVLSKAVTLEAPSLIDPGNIGGKEISTTRPTFKWKAPKDGFTEYQVLWSQIPNALGGGKIIKQNSSGSEKAGEAGYYYFAHNLDSIFDNALERDKTYYWKIIGKKADGTEIVSDGPFSFTCNPPLEISGITNYPNPFDPNKEKTKLRYKLSKEADDVKIRIYDLTGALVTELDGTTNAEGVNMWTKYNDILWDGKNGRGDVVLNGIYPFEVIARIGAASVSGRGKIAVLK